MNARLDHLVVVAPNLIEGVAWCERTLGVVPGPGGKHPLMGTHNRLMRVATPDWPDAYFEIIAIDPTAPAVPRRRWFDMDQAALRECVRTQGPQLAHWVLRVDDVTLAAARWAWMGIERGEALQASRATPGGELSWRITVREDGQRLMDGCLPTLIQWGAKHPATAMPSSSVSVEALELRHPKADLLRRALHAVGFDAAGVAACEPASAGLRATLRTPLGTVTLDSAALNDAHLSAGAA